MAIYLLNISADTEDLPTTTENEDLTINDQESFVEIFVEQILGFEDAIAEFNNAEPQNFLIKKVSKVKTQLIPHHQISVSSEQNKTQNQPQAYFIAQILKGFNSLEHPPPQHMI